MPSHSLSPAVSRFTLLAENGKFVDKTSALVEFLDSDDHPVHFLVRPRRSGKTTLLRLFRAFFERKDPADQEQRKKLFVNNKLAITKDDRFEAEFARYSVLYVDFSNMFSSTMDGLLQDFKNHVSLIAQQLETSGKFNNRGELDNSKQLFLDNVLKKTLDDSEWPTALFRLTTLLNTLSKRLVVVLVDEYDTPTSYAVQHGYFDDANNFFRKVFSPLLKNNECILGALVVGVMPVAKAGWFPGVNNLSVFRLDSERYSTACMFTGDETERLYNQEVALRGDGNPLSFSFEELKGWYNGYYTFDGIRLYNPWSIASAFSKGKLGPYWVKSGYDRMIEQRIYYMLDNIASFREQVAGLSGPGEGVEIEIEPKMSYHSIPEMTKTQLWTLIYFAGYLTKLPRDHTPCPADAPDHDSNTESQTYRANDSNDDSSRDMIELCLPNYEIRSVFDRWLRNHMKNCISAQER
ncbi:hypothetical protein PILCRDRAFT_12500 [Piloderma croceum F 1598]|uniref:AAA-ATPase-like domain-containing protein n=1 Tax=Piloderma croceum (strain F 1598) TaxID=765440 RepID=A0A0C3EW97_PILCF|nr:hypothetical protein PILCRDRAFT_12500 [Piloderma croceum F 1598]